MQTQLPCHLGLAKRAKLAIIGLLLTGIMYVGILGGPVSSAYSVEAAETFCNNVTLAPYGQYGDRCYAASWEAHPYLLAVWLRTNERAGCVSYAAQNSGDLKGSWYCIGSYSFTYHQIPSSPEPRRGVIRNNNLSYSGKFTGTHSWSCTC